MPEPISSLPDWHPRRLSARMPALKRRADLLARTRAFFTTRGYTEVETPALVPVPGMEVHLAAFRTTFRPILGEGEEPLWLRTSPELAIKRLLVAGAGPVFEIARVWRNGEVSARHSPEFTMLEWYRPAASLDALMDETEAYLRAMLPPQMTHRGIRTDLSLPFERLTVAEAFRRHCGGLDILATLDTAGEGDAAALRDAAAHAGVPPREGEGWEDLFFRLLLERIEPQLGRERATFLTHWPAPQAALARRDPADPRAALRFELFAGGIELANAFDELTDAEEQASRFARDVEERHRLYGEGWPVDEDFLAALRHGMPATAGIALGFDRLVMLAAGVESIEDTLWLGRWPYSVG
ncbi:EF-P lysine aminoacylase GenX [Pseudoroseomonas wenyumeiae]|uniref:EF-P lysine aminoacylase GenX n=1 Tax=Teichococcus wenyumeiae TaxID=2478470 RepID=A0A3A9JHQ7_9PROT|nr:EF-P lysine aminoacylase EpmA [Pseudoroseomonas wenyumeiae]RKK06092.1 EF-P lysine aminoacylase GenX [Pseudoroseomonas wenyumeiae]RMI25581.1 EF-P lysine aminoacylase GenX [Pseudoroseomonas wenyumeiae]